jgi:hypothetical protein
VTTAWVKGSLAECVNITAGVPPDSCRFAAPPKLAALGQDPTTPQVSLMGRRHQGRYGQRETPRSAASLWSRFTCLDHTSTPW